MVRPERPILPGAICTMRLPRKISGMWGCPTEHVTDTRHAPGWRAGLTQTTGVAINKSAIANRHCALGFQGQTTQMSPSLQQRSQLRPAAHIHFPDQSGRPDSDLQKLQESPRHRVSDTSRQSSFFQALLNTGLAKDLTKLAFNESHCLSL
ncbi:hypothetical protein PAPYR_4087 [Paratrimastix pyriformis]|uniref:Uncharacterized protein n=1 Tax=Paratrimastix pyriformis TaxID=342808 RepID=A0ABQ8UKF3_9EUKA|nr:hypothetical protein PAPYR_4087 [Paratrimastix pyriformis]